MFPSADQLFKDADFIFQQDLAPAHTAKSTKSWLNDHGVGVLDWPANSPDLNPIENLWGIVKRKMRNKRPKNADELKATVKEIIFFHSFYLSHTRLYREYITSSEMYSLHLTHPKWTHTRSSGQPCYGKQLGVRCLAQWHLSRGIEGGESAGYSLPHQQSLPNLRFEPTTFGLRVRLSNH